MGKRATATPHIWQIGGGVGGDPRRAAAEALVHRPLQERDEGAPRIHVGPDDGELGSPLGSPFRPRPTPP